MVDEDDEKFGRINTRQMKR